MSDVYSIPRHLWRLVHPSTATRVNLPRFSSVCFELPLPFFAPSLSPRYSLISNIISFSGLISDYDQGILGTYTHELMYLVGDSNNEQAMTDDPP